MLIFAMLFVSIFCFSAIPYDGILMPTNLFMSFNKKYHCPTAVRVSSLDYTDKDGDNVDVTLIGDPRAIGPNINSSDNSAIIAPKSINGTLHQRPSNDPQLLTAIRVAAQNQSKGTGESKVVVPSGFACVTVRAKDTHDSITGVSEIRAQYGDSFYPSPDTDNDAYCECCHKKSSTDNNPLILCDEFSRVGLICIRGRHRLCFGRRVSDNEVEQMIHYCYHHAEFIAEARQSAINASDDARCESPVRHRNVPAPLPKRRVRQEDLVQPQPAIQMSSDPSSSQQLGAVNHHTSSSASTTTSAYIDSPVKHRNCAAFVASASIIDSVAPVLAVAAAIIDFGDAHDDGPYSTTLDATIRSSTIHHSASTIALYEDSPVKHRNCAPSSLHAASKDVLSPASRRDADTLNDAMSPIRESAGSSTDATPSNADSSFHPSPPHRKSNPGANHHAKAKRSLFNEIEQSTRHTRSRLAPLCDDSTDDHPEMSAFSMIDDDANDHSLTVDPTRSFPLLLSSTAMEDLPDTDQSISPLFTIRASAPYRNNDRIVQSLTFHPPIIVHKIGQIDLTTDDGKVDGDVHPVSFGEFSKTPSVNAHKSALYWPMIVARRERQRLHELHVEVNLCPKERNKMKEDMLSKARVVANREQLVENQLVKMMQDYSMIVLCKNGCHDASKLPAFKLAKEQKAHFPVMHPLDSPQALFDYRQNHCTRVARKNHVITHLQNRPAMIPNTKAPLQPVRLLGRQICQACLQLSIGFCDREMTRMHQLVGRGLTVAPRLSKVRRSRHGATTIELASLIMDMHRVGYDQTFPGSEGGDGFTSICFPFRTVAAFASALLLYAVEVAGQEHDNISLLIANNNDKINPASLRRAFKYIEDKFRMVISITKSIKFMRCTACSKFDNEKQLLIRTHNTAGFESLNLRRYRHLSQVTSERKYSQSIKEQAMSVPRERRQRNS